MFGLAARVRKAKPQLIIYGTEDDSRILPAPTQAEREAASMYIEFAKPYLLHYLWLHLTGIVYF